MAAKKNSPMTALIMLGYFCSGLGDGRLPR